MSRMIPQPTVDVLRKHWAVAVSIFGIDCELYIPVTADLNQQEMDIYDERPGYKDDMRYTQYHTQVFIPWTMNVHQLRRMGLFLEKDVPLLAWFDPNLPITKKSWFSVNIEYIPRDRFDTDKFEVVDNFIKGMHDAKVLGVYTIAPLRKP